jgi:hypothetical protein
VVPRLTPDARALAALGFRRVATHAGSHREFLPGDLWQGDLGKLVALILEARMSITWDPEHVPEPGDAVVRVERSKDERVVWVHYASGKVLSSSIRPGGGWAAGVVGGRVRGTHEGRVMGGARDLLRWLLSARYRRLLNARARRNLRNDVRAIRGLYRLMIAAQQVRVPPPRIDPGSVYGTYDGA